MLQGTASEEEVHMVAHGAVIPNGTLAVSDAAQLSTKAPVDYAAEGHARRVLERAAASDGPVRDRKDISLHNFGDEARF